MHSIPDIIQSLQIPGSLKIIADKVFNAEEITTSEALELYNCSNLAFLGVLADVVKKRLSGNH